MIRVNQIRIGIFEDKSALKKKIAKKLRISAKEIIEYKIFKESIDARRKKIMFVYALDVKVKNESRFYEKYKKSPTYNYTLPTLVNKEKKERPVVIGAGPSGLFSALTLAEAGLNPIVVEMGEPVEERIKSIEKFWREGILNENSNVQFGEGGAGTFSDGKLTTRIKDPRCRKVLETFIEMGAPEEILYKKNPHIGTDYLRKVIIQMRKKIIALGGKFRFNTKVTDFILEDQIIQGVVSSDNEEIKGFPVILAIGHSSRALFEKIYALKIPLEAKPFAVGVRIEHLQQMIDKNQYGSPMMRQVLGAASYKLTYTSKSGRGVYSFCMCPGGEVVASASEQHTVVTNGMSYYKRNKKNSNAALLVTVKPEDFKDSHPLAGMYFQRALEKKAYNMAGKDYSAPATYVGTLLNQPVNEKNIQPSYQPSVTFCDFNELLPDFIIDPIKEALPYFNRKINGFSAPDAIITGVETRSSSPVRILRSNESFESIKIRGLYPCGEGAGYAGGIMSSAVDGIKVSEKIIENSFDSLE